MTPPTVEEALAYALSFNRTAGRTVPANALVVLAEEVTRLRADVARLDWLIDEGYVSDLRRFSDGVWTFDALHEGDSPRAAIDAAREVSA